MHRDSHHARIINGDDVRLRNGHSGKYMEIKGAIDADSTVVQQYPFNGGANQIWKLVKDKEGTYRIYTKLGSKTRVLDVKRLGTTDGTPIQIYTPNDSDGQRFILEYTVYTALSQNVCLAWRRANRRKPGQFLSHGAEILIKYSMSVLGLIKLRRVVSFYGISSKNLRAGPADSLR